MKFTFFLSFVETIALYFILRIEKKKFRNNLIPIRFRRKNRIRISSSKNSLMIPEHSFLCQRLYFGK